MFVICNFLRFRLEYVVPAALGYYLDGGSVAHGDQSFYGLMQEELAGKTDYYKRLFGLEE